jgi:DNA-binding protein HU-beta
VVKLELINELTEKLVSFKTKDSIFSVETAEYKQEVRQAKEDVSFILENLFDLIKKNLQQGKGVYWRGFGSFINKKRAEKKARNIHKGTEVLVEAHFVPFFKPAKSFVAKIKKSEKLLKKLKEQKK